MKFPARRLVVAVTAGLLIPASLAAADAVTRQHARSYERAYRAVARKYGHRAPGRNILRWGMAARKATDADIVRSLAVLNRMLHPAPVGFAARSSAFVVPPDSATTPVSTGGGYADVPGVPSGFAACVALRESTDGAGSSNIYGIQGPGGQGSVAQQKAAFAQMYAARGTEPWAPYDGC